VDIILRPATVDDAEACGTVCYDAFKSLAEKHGMPPGIPSAQIAGERFFGLLRNPGNYAVVAECEGRILGSNFIDERSAIAGIGPLTVAPDAPNLSLGRRLMAHAMDRTAKGKFVGVRLCQAAFNVHSFALYAKMGFSAYDLFSTMQGAPLSLKIPGYDVRPADENDLAACNAICFGVHGHDREGELLDALKNDLASVVECDGEITGYTTSISFFGHAAAKSNQDMMALIGAAKEFRGQGIMVPTRNSELLGWCLDHKLRIVQQMILMGTGMYQEPVGAYMPSVIY